MLTKVYVDGFNLYNRALVNTPYRWLDLSLLCSNILPGKTIDSIKYFTTRVMPDSPQDSSNQARQNTYIRALKTIPNLSIIYGKFTNSPGYRPLINAFPIPPSPTPQRVNIPVIISPGREMTKPLGRPNSYQRPFFVPIKNISEKYTDVNIASHMLLDAMKEKLDAVALISNDSDLKTPLEMLKEEFGLHVIIICTDRARPCSDLKSLADEFKDIRDPILSNSQFPDNMTDARGAFSKPPEWY